MGALSSRLYNITEGIRIAIEAMRGNKVRAGLTILGVAVGVFVVVVISAAVHGINASVAKMGNAQNRTLRRAFTLCFGFGAACRGCD